MAQRKVVSKGSFVDPNLVGTTSPSETSRVYLGTVEAQWTCASCGNSGIPGGTKKCPQCGNPKDATETYQPPASNAPYLTQDQLSEMGVDVATHESDEECPFCQAKVKPGTQKCPNCGGTIANTARTSRKCPSCGRETNDLDCPSCGADTVSKDATPVAPTPYAPHPPRYEPPIRSAFNWKLVGLVLLGLLFVVGLIVALWPRETTATVSSVGWTSTIFLQEKRYNQHSGWSIPSGGDYVGESLQIHHYDQVYDHTEEQCHYERQPNGTETEPYLDQDCGNEYVRTDVTCYDDGTCDHDAVYEYVCHPVTKYRQVPKYEDVRVCKDVKIYRSEPRYATMFTYNIWEWVNVAPAEASGNDLKPRWPELQLDNNHSESGRQQVYRVTFKIKEKSYQYNLNSVEEFQRYQIGSSWNLKRSGSKVLEVNPPK